MSEEFREVGQPPRAPYLHLNRLPGVDTYEVMEHDLRELERAYDTAAKAQWWLGILLGGLFGAAFSLLTAWGSMGDGLRGVVGTLCACLAFATINSAVSYNKAKREAPSVLKRIRGSYVVVNDPHPRRPTTTAP